MKTESESRLIKWSEVEHVCAHRKDITVADLREWLALLPEEFQNAPLEANVGKLPCTLKRLVAYRSKDGSCIGVVANPMGSHLPFDDSLKWEHVLS